MQWRTALKKFHAQKSGEILRQVGYPDDTISRVQSLNLKNNFPQDPESRVLEDALCLVFLENTKVRRSRRAKPTPTKSSTPSAKSWQKMTPAAHAEALKSKLPPSPKRLYSDKGSQRPLRLCGKFVLSRHYC